MRLSYAGRRTRLLTGAATGLAMLAFAGSVSAQEEVTAETEEVVVTGIRAAIQSSIAAKKTETSIVEVISAEDIGKLPDQSIADSLSRLPGLATQRLDGRAQVISVRGLSPDFTTSLLNGREQVSTGDNRGVEFDQYPSELLNQVVVYKTPDSALIGHGLAGTVDLRTVRPLAYGKRAIAASARYEWNGYDAKNPEMDNGGERFTVSYIDQFLDGKLGVALGYSHIATTFQIERYRAWGFPGGPNNVPVLGGAQIDAGGSEFNRDGYVATLEYRPTDNISTAIDVFYSEFENSQVLRGMELPLWWSSASLQPGFTTNNGLITSGTFNGVKAVLRTDYNGRESTNLALGWNTKWDFADGWTATADVSLSKVERDERVLEVYSGTGRNGVGATDNITYFFGDTGATFRSNLNYADRNLIQLTSPQGWGAGAFPGLDGGQDGYDKTFTVEDELEALRLSVERNVAFSIFSGFEIGANINGRTKTYVADEAFLGLKVNPASLPIPASAVLGATSLAHVGIAGVVAFDPVALAGPSGLYNYIRNINGDVRSKDWRVQETVLTGYAKADIDTTVFDTPLTGNIGLQVVNTRQNSGAFQASSTGATAVIVPVKDGDEYTEVLPSMNLIFELPEDQLLRFGVARTLARPRMDQMKAGGVYNFTANTQTLNCTSLAQNCSPWSGFAGNPKLRPWIATGIDLSYEKYLGGREGYIALAIFYKELESYVFNQKVVQDFTGFPITGSIQPKLFLGEIDSQQNGSGGELRGAEFALSLPFDYIWAPLEGFGAFASASFTESSIQPNPGNAAEPIPGLSKWVTNLTAYYEKDGFQARISQRYRTGFRGELSGFANGREIDWVREETIVDAQIGYEFQSGPLEGLSILAQGYNLTDEPFVVLEGNNPRLIKRYQEYGPTYSVGVSYRF